MIIAIDPGVHRCACAAFADERLVEVWFESPRTFKRGAGPALRPPSPSSGASAIVIEQPQFDARTRTAGRSVLDLAWAGALLAGAFSARDGAPIFALTPSEWKGSEPKPRHHARLWAELDDRERRLLGGTRTAEVILAARKKGALSRWSKPGVSYYPRSFETHNLLDAVALGAFFLGRLEKR